MAKAPESDEENSSSAKQEMKNCHQNTLKNTRSIEKTEHENSKGVDIPALRKEVTEMKNKWMRAKERSEAGVETAEEDMPNTVVLNALLVCFGENVV